MPKVAPTHWSELIVVPVTAVEVMMLASHYDLRLLIDVAWTFFNESTFGPHILASVPLVVGALVNKALPRRRNDVFAIRRRRDGDFDLGCICLCYPCRGERRES